MWRLRLSSDVITEQLDFKEALKKKKKKKQPRCLSPPGSFNLRRRRPNVKKHFGIYSDGDLKRPEVTKTLETFLTAENKDWNPNMFH